MSGPYARKVTAAVRALLRRKVVDLQAFSAARLHAEALQKTVARDPGFADMDPAHALYVLVHNQVSVFTDLLTALPQMRAFADLLGSAEEEYMPNGPPWSPLTGSFFWSWAFFDAGLGAERETIGTCVQALARVVPMHPEFLRLVGVLQTARMGVYVHDGVDGPHVRLRELVTEKRMNGLVPCGYFGRPGEIWFARVLPPPLPDRDFHIVFTTPYVVRRPDEAQWNEYFDRTLPKVDPAIQPDRRVAYESLMKWGLHRNYWSEFVLEAYEDAQFDAVFLAGLPDVATSRPCSPATERRPRR